MKIPGTLLTFPSCSSTKITVNKQGTERLLTTPSTIPSDTSTSPACQRLPGKGGISLLCPRAPPAHLIWEGEEKEGERGGKRPRGIGIRGKILGPGCQETGSELEEGWREKGKASGAICQEGKGTGAWSSRVIPDYPGLSRESRPHRAATRGRPRVAALPAVQSARSVRRCPGACREL